MEISLSSYLVLLHFFRKNDLLGNEKQNAKQMEKTQEGEAACRVFEVNAIEERLQAFVLELQRGDTKLNLRPEIGLNPEFFPLVEAGKKTTTVRYSKDSIHFPLHAILPLIISSTRGISSFVSFS